MRARWLIVLAAAALVAGGCGGGDDGTEGSAPDDATVSVASVDGVGDVLVDADGSALYASEQESDGAILCVESCATIWLPLTVDGQPTGSAGLEPDLGVVARPDGTRQVTFRELPLYSFLEDARPGVVTGNGFSDSFDEQPFTWHVVTPEGASTSDANSEEPSDGYSGGGYGR